MASSSALLQQHREVGRTRSWSRFVPRVTSEHRAPVVRHRQREEGVEGDGEEVEVVAARDAQPMTVVARLWMGVLAMFSLILAVGLVGMILGAWALGYRPVVVTSGSMAPAIRQGDVVITKKVDQDKPLGTQTVIDYEAPDGSGSRLHRIIEVTPEGYRTKGDANATADSEIVPPESVRGTGLVLAPFAGYVPLWVDEGRWIEVALSIVLLVAAATMSRKRWMWGGRTRPARVVA